MRAVYAFDCTQASTKDTQTLSLLYSPSTVKPLFNVCITTSTKPFSMVTNPFRVAIRRWRRRRSAKIAQDGSSHNYPTRSCA